MIGVLSTGDTVRFKGRGDVRMAAPWRPTWKEMRDSEWTLLQSHEELLVVGPVPYRCSFDWVLLRHNLPEDHAERWVIAREIEITRVSRAWETCVGQTAVVLRSRGDIDVGEVILITLKIKGSGEWIRGMIGEKQHHIEFDNLRLLVEEPNGYTRPEPHRR